MIKTPPRLDALHPASAVVFALLMVFWIALRAVPEPDPRFFRAVSRPAGYVALAAMLVPYAHIVRRQFRYRRWGRMTAWLRWHVALAYVAFGCALVHSRGRANSPLTATILGLFGLVMASGALGFLAQKLLYRFLPLMVPRELGLERLGPENQELIQEFDRNDEKYSLSQLRIKAEDVKNWTGLCASLSTAAVAGPRAAVAEKLPKNVGALLAAVPVGGLDEKQKTALLNGLNGFLKDKEFPTGDDGAAVSSAELSVGEVIRRNRALLDTCFGAELIAPSPRLPEAIERFFRAVFERSLQPQFAPWPWFFSRSLFAPVPKNQYLRAKDVIDPAQGDILDAVWELVEKRRRLDVEYWCHRLGRAWLLLHGPAAWALLLLVIEHVWMSIRYGGY